MKKHSLLRCVVSALCALGASLPVPATGAEDAARKVGRYEIKRMNTERGTPGETTNTTLRQERYFDGPIGMFRFDVPLPDEKTTFAGDPFEPRLGDIKMRLRFRPLKSGRYAFPTFVEAAFPTADPKSLGKGKYQLTGGIRMVGSAFEAEIAQTNSVAGDPNFSDVRYTKFELQWSRMWQEKYGLEVKLKPVVDWIQNGKTGAVAEIEGSMHIARDWKTWIMLGHRAWGPSGIATTYQTRLELGLNYTY